MQNPGFLLADAESWILLADAKSWISVGWWIILDSWWLMHYPGFLLADTESRIPVGWCIILNSCWLMHYPGFLLADAESLTHIGWYRIAVNRKQKPIGSSILQWDVGCGYQKNLSDLGLIQLPDTGNGGLAPSPRYPVVASLGIPTIGIPSHATQHSGTVYTYIRS